MRLLEYTPIYPPPLANSSPPPLEGLKYISAPATIREDSVLVPIYFAPPPIYIFWIFTFWKFNSLLVDALFYRFCAFLLEPYSNLLRTIFCPYLVPRTIFHPPDMWHPFIDWYALPPDYTFWNLVMWLQYYHIRLNWGQGGVLNGGRSHISAGHSQIGGWGLSKTNGRGRSNIFLKID